MKRKWNLFDLFLILLVFLTATVLYFSIVHPIHFSGLVKREGVTHYAEVEILLPDDLAWIPQVVPVGEEFRNVYGDINWKILGYSEEVLGGKRIQKVTVKLYVTQYHSGIVQYGKYTVVKGNIIVLINDNFFIEGRVFNIRVLEKVMM